MNHYLIRTTASEFWIKALDLTTAAAKAQLYITRDQRLLGVFQR